MQSYSRNPKTIIAFIGLIMLSFMLLGALYNQLSLSDVQGGETSFSALPYFEISANGGNFESISDFQKKAEDLPRGSVVELRGFLPYKENYDSYAICFLNYYCGVEVFCGDKLIHSYGEPSSQLVLGSGYHHILLPADYYLKEICIRFTVTVPSSLFSTSSLLFGQWETLYMYHIKQSPITFSMDIFMFMLGFVLIFISLVGFLYQRRFVIITWVGAIALVAGVWTLCNSKFIQPFIPNHDIAVHIEFQSFYLILLLLIMYFRAINSNNLPFRRICNWVFLFSSIAILTIELLQFLDIKDYPETLSFFHITGTLVLILFAFMSLYKIRKRKRTGTELYLLMALIGLVVFVLIDAGMYYYFINTSLSASPVLASHYGMMFFVVTLLMSIPNYISEFVNERNEKLAFKHLAFTDALTSLGNRARCEDTVKNLILSGADFTLVIFDLNFLKKINDTLGHKAGDVLLCGFADALTTCFPLSPAICRIGGDEFALILPYVNKEKLENDMDNYEKCLEKKAEEIGFSLSAAHGIARSNELQNPSWEGVFRLADARMYEMKSEMHKRFFANKTYNFG